MSYEAALLLALLFVLAGLTAAAAGLTWLVAQVLPDPAQPPPRQTP